MGDGQEKNVENNGVESNQEKKKEVEDDHIVLQVDMHCEACAKKVIRIVRAVPGVEDVGVDRKANRVVVKVGKTVEAAQLCQRIQKKTGLKAQIVSPLPMPTIPNPQPPQPKDHNHHQSDQPPPLRRVTLQVHMHCEACAQILRKRIQKMKGIESVETDVGKDEVIVQGIIADPSALVKQVYKRTRKQASILVPAEENKQDGADENNKGQDSDTKMKNQASDKQEPGPDCNITIITQPISRPYEYYWPSTYNYDMDYYNYHLNNYHPQIFSDENPNAACSVM